MLKCQAWSLSSEVDPYMHRDYQTLPNRLLSKTTKFFCADTE